MINLIKKVSTLTITAAIVFSFAVNAGADKGFELNEITAKDIQENRVNIPQRQAIEDKGILDWIPDITPAFSDESVDLPFPAKEWTLMVFMNAKNNLGRFANKDIKEMEKLGTTGRLNVVVELGKLKAGAKRLLIKKKTGWFGSNSIVLGEDKDADMGDYKRAIEFIKWTRTNFPAKHYMLILWDHGLGWLDPKPKEDKFQAKGICFDDETHNYIRTMQIGQILRESGGVDVFASNACLMQMAEVAYEMKDYTGAIIGSEEVMLAYGYDYKSLISFLDSKPSATPEQIGKAMVIWYKHFIDEGITWGPITIPINFMGATLSVIKPSALNELPMRLNNWVEAVMSHNEKNAVTYAIENVVRMMSPAKDDKEKMLSSFADLHHFVSIISQKAQSAEVKARGQELMGFITNRLVISQVGLNTDLYGDDFTNTRGIAIEVTKKKKDIPPAFNDIFETKYSDLALSKDSKWDEFLKWTDAVWQN